MKELINDLDWFFTRRFGKIDIRSSAYRDKALGKKVHVLGDKLGTAHKHDYENVSLLSYQNESGGVYTPFFTTCTFLKKFVTDVMKEATSSMSINGLDLFALYSTKSFDLVMDPYTPYKRYFSNDQIRKTLERHALKASLAKKVANR